MRNNTKELVKIDISGFLGERRSWQMGGSGETHPPSHTPCEALRKQEKNWSNSKHNLIIE